MELIQYTSGDQTWLDFAQPLWEKLNQHHEEISTYFSEDFRANNFTERKTKLLKKYAAGWLRVDLAQCRDLTIGYLISAVSTNKVGEIESIFVDPEFRGQAIGDELMRRALQWLDQQQVHTKLIAVAVGNQRAYSFYARFGFYPRVVMLKQKDSV